MLLFYLNLQSLFLYNIFNKNFRYINKVNKVRKI